MTEEQHVASSLIERTVEIVSAYVSNNSVPSSELPRLIEKVYGALQGLGNGSDHQISEEPKIEKPSQAQITKSVTPQGIISFIDGKSYKTLKRHLRGHGLDPFSYRERYGLSADYPMVAKSYSEARSNLARQIGLGQKSA